MNEPNVKSHADIANSTVILKTSFGLFGNSRKVSTSIIAGAEGTTLLKVQKTLLESPELKAIFNADTNFRNYLKSRCLPYESGLAILPLGPDGTYLKEVHQNILNYTAHRNTLVNTFMDMYTVRISEAKVRMQELADNLGVSLEEIWQDNEFPSVDDARTEFYFTYGYHSFSVPPELVLAGVYDQAKSNAENKLQKATDNIIAMMRQSALELVEHLSDRLAPSADGKKKRLHKSAVVNVAEFVADFKTRNIVNDTQLEEVMEKLGTIVGSGSCDIEALKDDASYHNKFHNEILGIQSELSKLVENVPGRKFKDLD